MWQNSQLMFKRGFWYDIIAILTLTLFTLAFFWRVFSPPSYFVAGDFGGSDFTDLFIPFKKLLQQSYQEGKFPFWTEKIGAGFPLLGEGEIQNFYPGNLLFLIFPFIWAFNLNLFLATLGIGVFTFFLARSLRLRRVSSLFAASAFAFSGPFILNLKHLTILTTAMWLPLELILSRLFFQRKNQGKRRIFLFLALCFALQFLSASPQITLLSVIACGFFFIIFSFPKKPKGQRALLSGKQISSFADSVWPLLFALLLGLGLGASQVFPSLEAKTYSTRADSFIPAETRQFALTPKASITFVIPFALANPAHPPAYETTGPLFWETCGYIGLSTLILAIGGLFFLKKDRLFYFLFFLGLSSLLLSFGANLPLGFIHKFPPFNAFRVPGRFLILTDFSLAFLAAKFLDSLQRKASPYPKFIPMFLGFGALISLMADLGHFGLFYNESVPARFFEKPPKTINFLKKKVLQGRVLSLGSSLVYEKIYKTNRGWRSLGEKYLLYNEILSTNQNLFWDIPGILSYAGMKVKTSNDFENLVLSQFRFSDLEKPVHLTPKSVKNLFLVGNIKYIVTPFIIEDENFAKVFEEKTEYRNFKIQIYEFKEKVERAFFVPKAEFIAGEIGRQQRLLDPAFNPKEKVLVEKPIEKTQNANLRPELRSRERKTQNAKVVIVKTNAEEVIVNVESEDNGFLVLADTFYPGWEAYVDGQKTEILRANHHFRATPIDKGKHQVHFIYQPKSLKRGIAVSLVSLGIWLSLLLTSLLSLLRKRA
jgi:hypothetical protein